MIFVYCDRCGEELYVWDYRRDADMYDEESNFWWTDGKKHLCEDCKLREDIE